MSASIPKWRLSGDFFDFCKCNIPCPCTFAQAPIYGDCEDLLVYHIKNGYYGETSLDGLNVLALSYFKGNIWEGNTKEVLHHLLTSELISNSVTLFR
jgi:hypothetical protein